MRVVIEGPDGSGKSTLCEMLREKIRPYFAMLRHSQRPRTPDDLKRYLTWVARSPAFLDLVIDRHPLISELIYGPLLRHRDLFTDANLDPKEFYPQIDRIVYCRPPLDVIIANSRVRPQLAGVHEHLEEIVAAYDRMIQELNVSHIHVMVYDYTKPLRMSYEELIFGRKS